MCGEDCALKNSVFVAAAVLLLVGIAWMLWPRNATEFPEVRKARSSEGSAEDAQVSSQAVPEVFGRAPEFSLKDTQGAEITTESLLGKVWLGNFIFTECRATCPAQTAALKRLKDSLQGDPSWPAIRLLSITVDPDHDSVDVLQSYAKLNGAEDDNWSFLTGARDEIWRLSREGFGMAVDQPNADGAAQIAHDPRAIVVDRLGQIRGYVDLSAAGAAMECQKLLTQIISEFQPPESSFSADLQSENGKTVTHLAQPPEILDTLSWLLRRQEQQHALVGHAGVSLDFSFRDTNATGSASINFVSQIVDEQRWRLQVNHYDHGNGVCAADVDDDGLIDLYFTSQVGPNGLWRNLGNGKFEDITVASGTGLPDRISVAASFADVDGDGDQDLYVTAIRDGNTLFLNDGKGGFTDSSAASGLDYKGHSSAATFFDYDLDGRLDLYLCNVGKFTTDERLPVRKDRLTTLDEGENVEYFAGTPDAFAGHLKAELQESSRLFHNDGGAVFSDVTESVGLIDDAWSGDATPINVNDDKWPDLYVLNMQGNDEYFENVEGKRFERKSREVFPKTSWGAMGVKVFDFDNDEKLDLFVTDMHSDMSEDVGPGGEYSKSRMQWPDSFLQSRGGGIFGNSFYRKDGAGAFTEISDQVGVENYWPWGMSVGDFNADGFQDSFVASSMNFPYRYGLNSVFVNDRGRKFYSVECLVGVEPRHDNRLIKPWFVCDCGGTDREHPICSGREGEVVVWSACGTRSSVVFDLDNDGDLDIVTNEFNDQPMVLISDLADQRKDLRFVKISLQSESGNRNGVGAVVRVRTNQQVQTCVNDGKSGYLSQSSLPLYFGLGVDEEIQQIEVVWPSGTRSVIKDGIEICGLVVISEQANDE